MTAIAGCDRCRLRDRAGDGSRTRTARGERAGAGRHRRDWARRVDRRQRARFERDIAKARAKDSLRAFAKLTEAADAGPRIVHDPPLIVPLDTLAAGSLAEIETVVQSAIESYRSTLAHDRRRLLERYRYVHAARKVVGVGSVGTRAGIALMLGRDDQGGSAEIEVMDAESLASYREQRGWALARAHARSGDLVAIAGYLGSGPRFDRAMASFAEQYADQSERDYQSFRDAAASGRLTAQQGL
jgi:hypothetical protein